MVLPENAYFSKYLGANRTYLDKALPIVDSFEIFSRISNDNRKILQSLCSFRMTEKTRCCHCEEAACVDNAQ